MSTGLTPTRQAALSVLRDVRVRRAWAHDLLHATFSTISLDERDRAFAVRLVHGVVSAEGTLDEVLDRHIRHASKTHPLVRDALRLATYELLFMSTPSRVAVHQGVEAVRSVAPRASGLANAVLRRVAAEADAFPWGDPHTDTDALARATAHPRWLVELLIRDLGRQSATAMLMADNEPAPLFVAHNPFAGPFDALLASLEADGASPVVEGPAGCVRTRAPAAAVRSAALAEGRCVVSDGAAQYCAALAAPGPSKRTVELAAGRGVKTVVMQAESMRQGGPGEIISADTHPFKITVLERRMRELAVPSVTAVVADTTDVRSVELLGGPHSADVVMVDAPCSGLGTLRRHPERRWRLRPDSIETLAVVGEAMLLTASYLVRPAGFVVYSTCTVTERENGRVVEAFLASSAGSRFRAAPLSVPPPPDWTGFVSAEGWFRSLPAPDGPDGHFAAVIKAV
ncbi:MAG TPA: transcription antitermination factor NusB [Coriobacteriia bacterium]|nr:transcription antitermination factor NusB [Coriobacteriia bacterium]